MNGPLLQATRQFDEMRIPSRSNPDAARVVFKTVLFYRHGGQAATQRAAIEALCSLSEDVQDHLANMQTAKPSASFRPFDLERFRDDAMQAIERGHASGAFSVNAGVFGGEPDAPSSFGGSVMAMASMAPQFADISMLEFSTLLMWDAANDFGRQVDRLKTAAAILKPVHGLAGFGLQYDRTGASTTAIADTYPVIRRFPGMHCSLDLSFVAESGIRRPELDPLLHHQLAHPFGR